MLLYILYTHFSNIFISFKTLKFQVIDVNDHYVLRIRHYVNRQCGKLGCPRARLKRDGTRVETRFDLSVKRTSPFKLAGWGGGGQFSRLLAAEVFASAVVILDTPCSEVECKTTGYPLHSHVSPSLPLPCVTVCHQVSTELFHDT